MQPYSVALCPLFKSRSRALYTLIDKKAKHDHKLRLTVKCMLARDKFVRRSQSAVELRSLGLPRQASELSLKELQQVTVELTTPEGHVYKVGRLSNEERAQKILK